MSATVVLVLVAALVAGFISAASLFPVRRFARQLGLLDRPGGHSSHAVPTPLGGGIGIYLGIVTTILSALAIAWGLQDAARSESLRNLFGGMVPDQYWDQAALHAPG